MKDIRLNNQKRYVTKNSKGQYRINKRYTLKHPRVAVMMELDLGDKRIKIATKAKLIQTPQGESTLEQILFDVVAGVLEKMTRSTLWKDTIYELREASFITNIITPDLGQFNVMVEAKEETTAPAVKSIGKQVVNHER